MKKQNANVKQTNAETGRPELILDDNKNERNIHTCDKMYGANSVCHITRMRPLVTFYTMTNIAIIYSHALFLSICNLLCSFMSY